MSASVVSRPTAADVLRTALELIPDEQHWLKGAYGEADGEPLTDSVALYVAHDAGRLDRCCMEGALLLAYWRLHEWPGEFFSESGPYRLLCDQVGHFNLSDANDSEHTTYAEMANAFRRAIAVAEGREP